MFNPFFGVIQDNRHKNFISYYHYEDEAYRTAFERAFSQIFINKSVRSGNIDPDNSSEYVKRLILEGYITNASVVTVLVGPNTKKRKHVDWEIAAGLNKKVGGYSGLIGILLPSIRQLTNGNYLYEDLPPRLAANAKSGYATIYWWNWITVDAARISNAINQAFQRRVSMFHLIDNSLPLFANNRP
jgi:hypothetical protein